MRIIGTLATALAIPVSLISLFNLSGLHDMEQRLWVNAISIIWAFVNFTALPFILAGFIARYDFTFSIRLAIVLFAIIAVIFLLVLFSVIPGSLPSVAFLALPPSLYLIGYAAHRQSTRQQKTAA